MTPPRWVDELGQPCPTRPCPTCGRVIQIKRVHPASARAEQWHAWSVATWVEWCGHQQEAVLVTEGDGWYSEIPVLGVASYASGSLLGFGGAPAGSLGSREVG